VSFRGLSLSHRDKPLTKILHVHVGPQANVVGKVPANVIRIVVEYDLVGVPIPIGAVAEVVGRYAEEESAEPEAAGTASAEMPDVSAANLTRKMSVLPGMVKTVVRVVSACIVTDPLIIRVHVRCLGMAWLVSKRRMALSRLTSAIFGVRSRSGSRTLYRSGTFYRSGAVRGDVAASNFMTTGWRCLMGSALPAFVATLLGKSQNGADQ